MIKPVTRRVLSVPSEFQAIHSLRILSSRRARFYTAEVVEGSVYFDSEDDAFLLNKSKSNKSNYIVTTMHLPYRSGVRHDRPVLLTSYALPEIQFRRVVSAAVALGLVSSEENDKFQTYMEESGTVYSRRTYATQLISLADELDITLPASVTKKLNSIIEAGKTLEAI